MKTDGSVFLGVCRRGTGGSCHTTPNTVILLRIFGEPTVSHGTEEGERGVKETEREIMFGVHLHHGGRLFPPHHYSSVNLGLPIKRDHTANMKYTLCVECLIKYWLQTYMNLPHQIEASVGGLPLIRCVWYGNECRKQQGLLHYTFPTLLIYLFCCHVVPSHCEVSVQPRMKLHLHIFTGATLDLHINTPFFPLRSLHDKIRCFLCRFDPKCCRFCTVFPGWKTKENLLEIFWTLMSQVAWACCWVFL